MIDAQDARATFERSSDAAPAYGVSWRGEASDWSSMEALADWRRDQTVSQLPPDFLARMAGLGGLDEVREASSALSRELPALRQALAGIVEVLDLDLERAFGVAKADDVPLAALGERLVAWTDAIEFDH